MQPHLFSSMLNEWATIGEYSKQMFPCMLYHSRVAVLDDSFSGCTLVELTEMMYVPHTMQAYFFFFFFIAATNIPLSKVSL